MSLDTKGLKFKDKLIVSLICLFPWAIVSGPFLSDAIVTILSIYCLFAIFINKEFLKFTKKTFSKEIVYFLLFYLIIILSFFNSTKIESSFLPSVFYIRFFLFSLIVVYFFFSKKIVIKFLLISLILLFFVLLVDALIQYTFGKNLIGLNVSFFGEKDSLKYVTSFFSDKRLGSFTARILPICITLILILENNFIKKNYLKELIILISFILVLLSSERVAMGYFLIFIFFYFFTLNKYHQKIFILVSSLFIFTTLIIFPKNIQKIYESVIWQSKDKKDFFYYKAPDKNVRITVTKSQSDRILFFSRKHENMVITSFHIFKENLFFGTGIKTFRIECKNYNKQIKEKEKCDTHPHNTYAQILSETGIFSFFIVAYLFLKLLYENFKIMFTKERKNKDKLILISNCGVILPLMPIIPSGSFYNNWISCLIFFALIFNFYVKKKFSTL